MLLTWMPYSTVDPSGDYEDLSLFPTTFDKLQRKVQVADEIGKKKLASPEGTPLVYVLLE